MSFFVYTSSKVFFTRKSNENTMASLEKKMRDPNLVAENVQNSVQNIILEKFLTINFLLDH